MSDAAVGADADGAAEELAYMAGKRRMCIDLLQCIGYEFLSMDGSDLAGQLALAHKERLEAVAALREVCADYGDNDWEDNLNLADVIDKHLARPLADGEDE